MNIRTAQVFPDVVEMGQKQTPAAPIAPPIDPNAPPDFSSHDPNAPPTFTQTQNTGWAPQANNNEVKEMQQAILNFGATLAAHPVMSMQQSGTQERPGAQGTDYLGGTTPFGSFLVHQYVNNADVVGQQFINVGLPEPQRTGSAMPNVDLKGIINTISYIGTPGHEQEADGIWQNRTNNALKEIYAVGKAMMQFAKDMRFNVGGFSDSDLEAFRKLIPVSYTTLKGAAGNIAKQITPFINKLTALYKTFESTILEHPEFKALINQDKPFMDHSQITQAQLSKDEDAFYQANKDAVIPGANINGKPVRLMDIVNMTAFKAFLKDANVDTSKLSEIQKYVNELKVALSGTEFGPGF